MKRALLIALALLAAACSQATGSPPANVSGVQDIASIRTIVVGDGGVLLNTDNLFITSTDHNELRALSLGVEPDAPIIPNVQRDYVRAPNPLEPLSIPVLDNPVGLARDVRYDPIEVNDENYCQGDVNVPEGTEIGGPYVYVRSGGASEISVVNGDDSDKSIGMRELFRLPTIAPVTAMSAEGHANAASTLFFATVATGNLPAAIWKVSIEPPSAVAQKIASGGLDAYLKSLTPKSVFLAQPGESVTTMLALAPTSDFPTERLAIALRKSLGASGNREGRTVLFDLSTQALTTLKFPAPVRMLATHARACPGPTFPGPGGRIFGVMDEEACGADRSCSGILAVNGVTGEIENDATGNPMLPLKAGSGVPMGEFMSPRELVNVSSNGGSPLTELGVMSSSTSEIFFFDAFGLRHIDYDPSAPTIPTWVYRDNSGNLSDPSTTNGLLVDPCPTSANPAQSCPHVELADGATRDENVYVIYEGTVTGFETLVQPIVDKTFTLPTGAPIDRIAVGDKVVVGYVNSQDATDQSRCSTGDGVEEQLTITAITPTSVTVDSIGDCVDKGPQYIRDFSIRASGKNPWVVLGDVSGYMGRTHGSSGQACTQSSECPAGEECPTGTCVTPFKFAGSYYFHPDGFNPATPQLKLYMAPDPPAKCPNSQVPCIATDYRYVLNIAAHYLPLGATVDPGYCSNCYLPRSVFHDEKRQKTFVAYPSSNGIVEFTPPSIVPGANAQNIQAFH